MRASGERRPTARLREPPRPLGHYEAAVQTGSLLVLSGMLPLQHGAPTAVGRLGDRISLDEGRAAARLAALNALAAAAAALGSVDRIRRVVRVTVSMTTTPESWLTQQSRTGPQISSRPSSTKGTRAWRWARTAFRSAPRSYSMSSMNFGSRPIMLSWRPIMSDWHRTAAARALGVPYPIIQGPFGGGQSSSVLTAAVSNLGGLGSYGARGLNPKEIRQVVADIRRRTSSPFAVNLWLSTEDDGASRSRANSSRRHLPLLPLYREFDVEPPAYARTSAPRVADQIEALIDSASPRSALCSACPTRSCWPNAGAVRLPRSAPRRASMRRPRSRRQAWMSLSPPDSKPVGTVHHS